MEQNLFRYEIYIHFRFLSQNVKLIFRAFPDDVTW